MFRSLLAVIGLIAALLVLRWPGAGGSELLPNGGFEAVAAPWAISDGQLDVVESPVHGGATAGRITGTFVVFHEAYQFIDVQPGASYTFSGWAYLDDAAAAQVFLRIYWYTSEGGFISQEQSVSITIHKAEYQSISTAGLTAPDGAVRARVGIWVQPNGPFSVYVDDFSLDGPPPTPTPSPTPLPTPTPVPSPTPSPTPSGTPAPASLSPSSTPNPTLAATPTATPSDTATPVATPGTTNPTGAPPPTTTSTPVVATHSPSPTWTSQPTPTRTPTPAPSPTTDPDVFPELTNGSFEVVDGNGRPFGWRKFGGEMTTSPDHRTLGDLGLEFRSDTASTKWVYQTVKVVGDDYYSASADANAGVGAESAFIRVSWYASEDGSGASLGSGDSDDSSGGGFQRLDTGALQAPSDARTARVRLMLRPISDAPAVAYFDDVQFATAPGPSPTPTPTSSSPTPTPSNLPTGSPTPTSKATPSPTPLTVASSEPDVFPGLTNAGFEQIREDGTPYGWRKVGGAIAAVTDPHSEGHRALQFTSSTVSTKWVHQTISVEPGAYYAASVQALKDNPAAEGVFLRLSWYTAENGEGSAIESVDSLEVLTTDSPAFREVVTGAIRAPSEARSVRLKLMFRPVSADAAAVHFDDVRFDRVAPPNAAPASTSVTTAVTAARGATSAPAAESTPAALGVVATPVVPVNDRPQPTQVPVILSRSDRDLDWLTFLAMGVAIAALGLAGFSEWRRRSERRPA